MTARQDGYLKHGRSPGGGGIVSVTCEPDIAPNRASFREQVRFKTQTEKSRLFAEPMHRF